MPRRSRTRGSLLLFELSRQPWLLAASSRGRPTRRWVSVCQASLRCPLRQRPVEWCISASLSTSVFVFGGLEFERDVLLEIEDGRAVHGQVAAV